MEAASLETLESVRPLLATWGLRDAERGWRNLAGIANALGPDLWQALREPFARLLPLCPDPDMALNNLERFLSDPGSKLQTPLLREGRVLETLLQLLGTSQFFGDLLVANPDYLDMLLIPLRKSPSRAEMHAQLQADLDAAREDGPVLRAFRRFRQRHVLRIGVNDIIHDRPLEEVVRDLSRVADVCLEGALALALKTVGKRFGQPFTAAGQPARCVALAFGKLGGKELNYSSDVDLMFLYDEEGHTRGVRGGVENSEFFGRVVTELVRLVSAHTDRGQAYRIDLRLRPEGQRGPLARSLASTLAYYDTLGRTWERQALIKLRPVAGDLRLGERFLQEIEPFVYRKYLSFAEINEIKAMKRRIEHKVNRDGDGRRDVKTGHGGIRDIEFTLQFLQLLNGGDLTAVRQRNTIKALRALERVGCLTDQEYHLLYAGYRFLRKAEHRLQLLFDRQTHRLPERDDELRKLALRMGYANKKGADPLAEFLQDCQEKTDVNRKILNHLLHQTFEDEHGQAEPESDLILDPDADAETVRAVLGRYPFRDVPGAFHNLIQLARESVPFLSGRRCRHFLASIAPQLLRALAETPDPDMALVNLEKVTASLGAKAVLWELFSFNPPSLKLYVDLCAYSQFLSEILITNPGMIDELLDSLVLNQPQTYAELREELATLCKGAADPDPILHSFQKTELLRIGVRDILGKDTPQATTAVLSDLAQAILAQITSLQKPGLTKRYGVPYLAEGRRSGLPSRYSLLALGKLGGREMSYHSDLDLFLVYEGDGRTGAPPGARWPEHEQTDNFHYFTELARRVIKTTGSMGPLGRLYQVDMRLRPTGKSGSLVLPLGEFRRYCEGSAQVWERLALTRARVVHGDEEFGRVVMAALRDTVYPAEWPEAWTDEVLAMRNRLEASRSERDLKRGFGGLADVEFLVQYFQLKYGRARPELCTPNTREALDALRRVGLLGEGEYQALRGGYDFLRLVESRLRIVHNRSLDQLPENADDLAKLARRLGLESGDRLLAELERNWKQIRELFLERMHRDRSARG
jgi:glutamate-ammonia-ligase adenylyltransferase